MPSAAERRWLVWEELGDVTLVRFLVQNIKNEPDILGIFESLTRLVEVQGCQKLLLNCGNLKYVASYAIGKLLQLNQKIQAAGGQLALCCPTPVVQEILAIMKLKLNVYPTEREALDKLSPDRLG